MAHVGSGAAAWCAQTWPENPAGASTRNSWRCAGLKTSATCCPPNVIANRWSHTMWASGGARWSATSAAGWAAATTRISSRPRARTSTSTASTRPGRGTSTEPPDRPLDHSPFPHPIYCFRASKAPCETCQRLSFVAVGQYSVSREKARCFGQSRGTKNAVTALRRLRLLCGSELGRDAVQAA
ncbi:uncharacterized protein LOC126143144 [Schistocerca cancellata]|uniref:uncharacterized protein LOC126143144 n=1 Tax=Schistocerca cancellata TaxID=274614 RepID=UPI002117BB20|nr:uncharacterized protein LOC126143144 [Schistocerca cancellata]